MENEKTLKRLDYSFAFFLLMFVAALISRFDDGSDFYPRWLIILFFALMLVVFFWRQKVYRTINPPLPKEAIPAREEKKFDMEAWRKQQEIDSKLDEKAHDLIVEMCEFKNIRLALKQMGRNGGHYEIPEIWTIEKPVPLTPDELYAISSNRVLHAVTELHDDKIIYAHGFSRNGGWISYELAETGRR